MPKESRSVMTLDKATAGQRFVITDICAPLSQPEWKIWLIDLGFAPGECVEMLHQCPRDPLVFRIGQTKIALRRSEAACIQVIADVGRLK